MTPRKAPLLLLAFERSGTNLLRRIMGGHSAFAAPPAIHLVEWLSPHEPFYGDFAEDGNFRRLVEDAREVTQLSFQPWPLDWPVEEPLAEIAPADRSLLCLFEWMFSRRARAEGRARWFCKDRHMIRFAHELGASIPDARFIHLVRDPRDVYSSYRKADGGFKHPIPFAERWVEDTVACLRASSSTPLKDRIIRVRYEDLLDDPRETVAAICEFVGESFEEGMLETRDERAAAGTAYWQNLRRPIMRGNAAKYRTELPASELQLLESAAHRPMRALGYQPEAADSPAQLPAWRRALYRGVHLGRARLRSYRAEETPHEREIVSRRQRFRAEIARRSW